jgi:hypothetical protein
MLSFLSSPRSFLWILKFKLLGLVRVPGSSDHPSQLTTRKCCCIHQNSQVAILAARFISKSADNDALSRTNEKLTTENVELLKKLEKLELDQKVSRVRGEDCFLPEEHFTIKTDDIPEDSFPQSDESCPFSHKSTETVDVQIAQPEPNFVATVCVKLQSKAAAHADIELKHDVEEPEPFSTENVPHKVLPDDLLEEKAEPTDKEDQAAEAVVAFGNDGGDDDWGWEEDDGQREVQFTEPEQQNQEAVCAAAAEKKSTDDWAWNYNEPQVETKDVQDDSADDKCSQTNNDADWDW